MGVLEHAPGGIAPMAVQISHEVTAGEPIVLAGWGFDGSCLNTGEAWTLRSKSGVLAPQTYSAWCCFEYNAASFTGVNCFTTPPGSNWVIGNMHDSGAPLLSPDPQDPQTLRLVGMAVGVTSAMKVSAWNDGGGMPALADTPARRCPADLNGDGRTDVNDLFMLVSRVLNGDPLGDVDGNSAITPNDLFVYLGWYFGGC
jgi:hypothetical protein